jgi:predicted RNase H-like nuclease (RuvC/YqgF family)
MNEQTHTTEENVPNEKVNEEIGTNSNAEQTVTETSGSTSGSQKSEQVDFAQMYDMLTERDSTIKNLQEEIKELKKTNTNLLLKVNSSSTKDGNFKNPYESFIDGMVNR